MESVDTADEMKCPRCGHPANGDCGGDYIPADSAYEYVADNVEPPDEEW